MYAAQPRGVRELPSLRHVLSVDGSEWRCVGTGDPAAAGQLPGAGGGKRAVVRTRSVALSPTGRSWAAATTGAGQPSSHTAMTAAHSLQLLPCLFTLRTSSLAPLAGIPAIGAFVCCSRP